jgi:hypothetical protein
MDMSGAPFNRSPVKNSMLPPIGTKALDMPVLFFFNHLFDMAQCYMNATL